MGSLGLQLLKILLYRWLQEYRCIIYLKEIKNKSD